MQNLFWKIAIIVVAIAISVWAVIPPQEKIRLGKDLRGGISLIYKVNIPEDVSGTQAGDIVRQVIEVLKERVNPQGVFDISFNPQGRDRIEIVMPLPSDRVKAAEQAYKDALDALRTKAQIDSFELDAALEEGNAAERWAGAGEQTERIEQLQELYDAMTDLRAEYQALQDDPDADPEQVASVETQLARAELDFEELRSEILRLSLSRTELMRALRLSTEQEDRRDPDTGEIVKDEEGNPVKQPSARQLAVEDLKSRFPHVQEDIDRLFELYDDYAAIRTGYDDPEDLKRLLRGSGVLEYHIAVQQENADQFNLDRLREQLQERGPENVDAPNVAWYPINDIKQWAETARQTAAAQRDPQTYFAQNRGLIAADFQGRIYLLLYTTPDRSITHDDPETDWSITRAFRGQDQLGRPAVSFQLDDQGGSEMGRLTGPHVGDPMAIVLDGEVYSAPNINERIFGSGIIQGNFSNEEITYLIRVLRAGSLRARLNPDPIAENTIGPSIGQDNLTAGLQACIAGMIAVAIFMLIYYFFAGFVADFALILNGLLIFGVMALQQATFTLPGIAGIVLTIGMAVDANVLIYERIREELFAEDDVDLKTAIRLGYQKAFSTIIDANITNLIVCFVLYQTATAEVKGFALTLGIGILATLFTALFVTRVIYAIYTDVFKFQSLPMLATKFPAVHRTLEPNINWLRLRKIFQPISVILVITGVILVSTRGAAMLDTEFRGGVAMTFKTGMVEDTGDSEDNRVLFTRPEVEDRIHSIAADHPGDRVFQQFANAVVITVGNAIDGDKYDTFQVKVALPSGAGEEGGAVESEDLMTSRVVRALQEEFSGELDQAAELTFDDMDLERNPEDVYPVTDGALGEVIEVQGDERRVTNYLGGAAIVIENIQPAVTLTEVRNRIDRMRQQQGFAAAAGRQYTVFGLEGAAGREEDAHHAIAVVVKDPDVNYFDSPDVWESQLADLEWRLITQALSEPSVLEQVSSFSSAVAQTLAANAVVAVILSFLGILVYVWVRFGSLRYSLAALVALVHDVCIALGILALTAYLTAIPFFGNMLKIEDFRIDLGVVAALLTIIGYSLNDTIVILDRIRENRGKRLFATAPIINRSINQTVSRTILTSFTTLLAVAIMYYTGGTGIRPFAFCLLVGILVGTYSSVAIAAPLVHQRGTEGRSDQGTDALPPHEDDETAALPDSTRPRVP